MASVMYELQALSEEDVIMLEIEQVENVQHFVRMLPRSVRKALLSVPLD